MTKRKKRSINDIRDPTFEELATRILNCPPEVRAYLSLLWLTGNRVSEILGIKARKKIGEYYYKRPTKKNPERVVTVSKYRQLTPKECFEEEVEGWEVEPLRKWDVEVDTERPILRLHNIRTLKRAGRPMHTYMARIDFPQEKEMWEHVVDYISQLQPRQALFSFSRQKAWMHCNKALGVPPHKLRGLRATRLAVEFDMDAIDLQNQFNWANAAMPLFYAKKNTRDRENKLLRVQPPSAQESRGESATSLRTP